MSATTEVAILGAGNLGALVHDCLQDDERWHCTSFHDDGRAGGILHGVPILGTGPEDLRPGQAVIIAIGDPATRRSMVERLSVLCLDWQTFIDRRSVVGREAKLGTGTVVLPFAMVASGVTTGPFCYFSSYSHAGTGSTIGTCTSLLAAASVGESVVGAECILGLKSICLDGAILGDRVTVAPMTVVRRQVPDGALVAGSPARVFLRNKPGRSISAAPEHSAQLNPVGSRGPGPPSAE